MKHNSTSEEIKLNVKRKYAAISKQNNQTGCCEPACGCSSDKFTNYTVLSDDYSGLDGYNTDADLGLGCGLPTEFAKIDPGDTVVDLGSGAGNDCFVARHLTGERGHVTGVDFTKSMIEKARKNAEKLQYKNVEFLFGDIEDIPLADKIADVVISNCVLNLVPDKKRAFPEIFRILKNGGQFSISDIVISGNLPKVIREDAEMYTGCVAGAIKKEHYLTIVKEAGFTNISIQKIKEIQLSDDLLSNYLNPDQIEGFRSSGAGIYSITLFAEKIT